MLRDLKTISTDKPEPSDDGLFALFRASRLVFDHDQPRDNHSGVGDPTNAEALNGSALVLQADVDVQFRRNSVRQPAMLGRAEKKDPTEFIAGFERHIDIYPGKIFWAWVQSLRSPSAFEFITTDLKRVVFARFDAVNDDWHVRAVDDREVSSPRPQTIKLRKIKATNRQLGCLISEISFQREDKAQPGNYLRRECHSQRQPIFQFHFSSIGRFAITDVARSVVLTHAGALNVAFSRGAA